MQQYNTSEEKMVSYLKQCVEGLKYMQEHQISHSAINIKNIYFVRDAVKVSDPVYFGHQTNFVKILQNPHTPEYIYLSPTLVKAIFHNNWQPKHKTHKSDVFALGMSFLHFANNETNSDCYQYDEGVFYEDRLILKMNRLRTKYPQLWALLQPMVIANEEQRPDFVKLTKLWTERQRSTTESRDLTPKASRPQLEVQQPVAFTPQQIVAPKIVIQQQKTLPPPPTTLLRRINHVMQVPPQEYIHQYYILSSFILQYVLILVLKLQEINNKYIYHQ